jgi:2-C-methyl-D-erythritol 4-phosphate cytidylyltransferase
MGFDKILAPLAGKPVLQWSLTAFCSCPQVHAIVVVAPAGREQEFSALCSTAVRPVQCVAGGARRGDSVAAGLRALPDSDPDSFVAVHDAARPLITPEAISACLDAAATHGAAALASPLADTLHRAGPDGTVADTLPREHLWCAQTPQIARRSALLRAVGFGSFTDEVAALAAAGMRPMLIEWPSPNFKITTPRDLAMAEALLRTSIA